MKRHHPLLMLVLAFALSFAFAIVWVVVMDYGQSPFSTPMVLPIMSIIASIAAIFTYPFLYIAFFDKQLPRAIVILFVIVVSEIIIVTPFNAGLSFIGSFLAYFYGLYVARYFTPFTFSPGYCVKCGYCLTGIPNSINCPECGLAIPRAQ